MWHLKPTKYGHVPTAVLPDLMIAPPSKDVSLQRTQTIDSMAYRKHNSSVYSRCNSYKQ